MGASNLLVGIEYPERKVGTTAFPNFADQVSVVCLPVWSGPPARYEAYHDFLNLLSICFQDFHPTPLCVY